MANVTADIQYSLRTLRTRPATAAAAILTLALGIGGTTAMFSVVDTVLLRPLPYAAPESLVAVWSVTLAGQRGSLSPGDFVDFRRNARAISDLAAIIDSSMSLTGAGDPEEVRVQSVSGNFFTLLGVPAVAGRTFLPEDDERGSPNRVLLSEPLWKERFEGRPDLAGIHFVLGGQPMEVIGVVPASFRFDRRADLWMLGSHGIPRATAVPGDLTHNRDVHILHVIGRLSAGTSIHVAQAELDAEAADLARRYPQTNTGYGVALEPLQASLVGNMRAVVLFLFAAVAALLVIALVNVANLMLVRTGEREAELRMRSALGATRARLFALVLIDALALAALGGLAGLLAAAWGVQIIMRFAPPGLPRLDEVAVDVRVLTAGVAITVAAVCAFGALPAWWASRTDTAAVLQGVGRTSVAPGRRRAQWLLVGQLALAQTLVVTAGLLALSFSRLLAVDPGVVARGVVTAGVSLPAEKYAASPARKALFHETVLRRIAALPGITGAAMSLTPPLSESINRGVWIEGRPTPPPGERQTMSFVPVSETYFDLLGISRRRGRGFTVQDAATSERVAIVNEAFVRRYVANADPLSQRIGFGNPASPTYWRRVVGVVADVRERLNESARPTAYVPFRQDTERWNFGSYSIRSTLPAPTVATMVRRAISSVDPDQPTSRVRTLEDVLSSAVAVERFTTLLASTFGVLALLLAAVGTFGIASRAAASRRRELGLRLAVGATSRDIVALAMREGLRTIVPAVVAGFALSVAAARWIESLLYRVTAHDPLAMGVAATVLVATALLATYLPVRRVLDGDPIASLGSN